MWIHVYPNWKTNFNSKNGRKTSFSFETKASKSFISTRRMWLWCPIMKRKKIIMWIHVYPYGKMNFHSKNGWKTSFSYEIKASKSFILTKRIWLWCPIVKKKDVIMWIHVYLIQKQTSILKMVRQQVFLMKPKWQYHLSQWGECDYGAQSWKKGDCYVNPCLSQFKDELRF